MKFLVLNKKQLSMGIVGLCLTFALIIGCVKAIPNAVATAGQARKIPIYNVATNEKKIALTFDAAWGNEDTQDLIDILAQYNAKATFFVVGEWVDKYPESVKALSDAGHDVMNHSDTHPDMAKLSKESMIKEIQSCNSKIEAVTGKKVNLFRAPFGSYNNTLIEALDSQNMKCIQWDVDSLDWKDPDPDALKENVLKKAKSGSIVLFHNAAKNTPDALPIILQALTNEGYSFVKVNELIFEKDYYIDHAGCQRKSDDKTENSATNTAADISASTLTPETAQPYFGDAYMEAAMKEKEYNE